jgi:hypothetical protein
VTTPSKVVRCLASNSAENEWCATSGRVKITTAAQIARLIGPRCMDFPKHPFVGVPELRFSIEFPAEHRVSGQLRSVTCASTGYDATCDLPPGQTGPGLNLEGGCYYSRRHWCGQRRLALRQRGGFEKRCCVLKRTIPDRLQGFAGGGNKVIVFNLVTPSALTQIRTTVSLVTRRAMTGKLTESIFSGMIMVSAALISSG